VSLGSTKITEQSLLDAVPEPGQKAVPDSYNVLKSYKGTPFLAWVNFTFDGGGEGGITADLPPGKFGWVLVKMPSSGLWPETASWVMGQAGFPLV
jgi:hypothetical protein